MKNIRIPETAKEYQEDILERALPEELIAEHPFYKNLINWVLVNRTPLLYDQEHTDEYRNLSINFNWLLLRDYSDSTLGPADTIHSMYALHEFSHMTHWLPTRLDEISAGEYAEQFTRSEYRASNETEILIHYRIPGLRELVFEDMRIAYDVLEDKGIEQPTSEFLARIRPIVVEDDIFDEFFADSEEDMLVGKRFKEFNGNREWAMERFKCIRPYFLDRTLPSGSGLTDSEYEVVIEAYDQELDQETYEKNMIRNVRLGYAMCGLEVPEINSFAEARIAASRLEGHRAIVQT